jgi:hypothetical protein
MRKSLTVLAAAATLCLAAGASQAMPVSGGAMRDALDATNMIEQAAIYVVDGRRYCFYFDGWRGAGWYRCGYSWRRGLGWGGVYGWRNWEYGPAARRFGRGGMTVRERTTIRERGGIRERGRDRGDVREGRGTRERGNIREGSTIRGRGQPDGTSGRGSGGRGGETSRGETSSGSERNIGGGGGGGGGEMSRSPGGGGGGGEGHGGGGGRGDGGGGRGEGGGRGGER